MNNNSIEFIIGNNEGISFNVENSNQNIEFSTQDNENIGIDVENLNENVSMAIQDSGSNLSFQLRETPMATNNYERLVNKPSINSVVLIHNKTSEDLGLQPAGEYADAKITNLEIDALF